MAKNRRKKRASPEAIAERKRYARTFFRAAGMTLNEKDHEKLDIGILMALKQIKDGDLSDRPRLEICYVLCAVLNLAGLFPEKERIEDTIRFAYLSLSFAREVNDQCGPEHLKSLPGIFDALDFGVDIYCQMHQAVSARELLSALHKAQHDLSPVVRLVRGRSCSMVIPESTEDGALPATADPAMVARRGVAWIHDAPTPGRYIEDDRGYAWVSDSGARIAIERATPVVWEGEKNGLKS